VTTAPATDERQHIAAVSAALTASVGANRVFEYGKVPGQSGNPGSLPDIFVLPALERRNGPTDQGRARRSGWRLQVRYVGRTANEARWAAERVSQALEGKRLTVDGVESTPVVFESATRIAPDDGRYSGESVWTYAL
jgi:hypothetical protein